MTGAPGTADGNRAIVREIYDAAVHLDLSVLERYLADDCRLIEPAGHPIGRTEWNGREEFLAGVRDVFGMLHLTGLRIKEIVADGPFRVIGLLDVLITDADGAERVLPVAELFRIENGKIVEIQAYYFDLVEVAELIGP